PMLPELEIVGVCRDPRFPYEYELVLRAVERAHARVRLVPDAEVLELAIDHAAGTKHFPEVAPVDTDLVDRAVDRVVCETAEDRLEECREFGLAHLAGANREFAMTDAAEASDVAINCDVVGRVGEHEFALGAFEQAIVGALVAGICAQQAMSTQQP